MSSIIKVDQIQLSDGSAPTASDLGLNTSGSVLQVVQSVKTDAYSTTSTSYTTPSGLSIAITPKSTSSKILVLANVTMASDAASFTMYRLYRDSTDIYSGDASPSRHSCSGMAYVDGNAGTQYEYSVTYLDSPSTTSQITYSFQVRAGSGGGGAYINRSSRDAQYTVYDLRTASSITLIEIAG
jgi:hypothetical protein